MDLADPRNCYPAVLISEAERRADCELDPNGSYLEGLTLVCNGLRGDRVTSDGRKMLATDAIKYLVNRAKIDDYHQRHLDLATSVIEQPIVILGLPRTGTTVLSYLFDQDPQWRSLLNWEAVQSVPPPTTATLRTDRRCLELLEFQETVFPLIDPPPPHWEWANGPTECTFLLAQDFKAAMWETRIPNEAYREFIANCDMSSAYRHHRRALQVLQHHAPGRWVLKMPAHAFFVDALLAEYPDARVIWAHRDPYKATASFMDLVGFAHGLSLGSPDIEWIRNTYPDRLLAHIERARPALANRDVHHVHFLDFINDPIGSMEGIYEWIGATLDDDVRTSMTNWLAEDPIRRPRSRPYGLAEWGLSREELEPRFGDYVRDFGVGEEP